MHRVVVKTITSLILHDNLLQINAWNHKIKENFGTQSPYEIE